MASIYFVILAGVVIFGMMVFAVDYGRLYLIQGINLPTTEDASSSPAALRFAGAGSAGGL